MSIRVFLLDDHEIVRTGLRSLFEAADDFVVVGEAGTAAEALDRIPPTHPDVALLDVRLPDGSGIEVCREIRSKSPDIACVMLTSYADDEALLAATLAGASGYVLKQVGASSLVDDVRRVADGGSLLDPKLSERAIERLREGPRKTLFWPNSPLKNGGSSIWSPRDRPIDRSPARYSWPRRP